MERSAPSAISPHSTTLTITTTVKDPCRPRSPQRCEILRMGGWSAVHNPRAATRLVGTATPLTPVSKRPAEPAPVTGTVSTWRVPLRVPLQAPSPPKVETLFRHEGGPVPVDEGVFAGRLFYTRPFRSTVRSDISANRTPVAAYRCTLCRDGWTSISSAAASAVARSSNESV
jgi:hypothetical protein